VGFTWVSLLVTPLPGMLFAVTLGRRLQPSLKSFGELLFRLALLSLQTWRFVSSTLCVLSGQAGALDISVHFHTNTDSSDTDRGCGRSRKIIRDSLQADVGHGSRSF